VTVLAGWHEGRSLTHRRELGVPIDHGRCDRCGLPSEGAIGEWGNQYVCAWCLTGRTRNQESEE
jgi:hypothetical protein